VTVGKLAVAMILAMETVVALVTEMGLEMVRALGQVQVLEKVMGTETETETALVMAMVVVAVVEVEVEVDALVAVVC
jgi:hypothetical protein